MTSLSSPRALYLVRVVGNLQMMSCVGKALGVGHSPIESRLQEESWLQALPNIIPTTCPESNKSYKLRGEPFLHPFYHYLKVQLKIWSNFASMNGWDYKTSNWIWSLHSHKFLLRNFGQNQARDEEIMMLNKLNFELMWDLTFVAQIWFQCFTGQKRTFNMTFMHAS